MNLKPMNDSVVAIRDEEPDETEAGIVIPETANKQLKREATVVAVGPGRVLKNGQRAGMPFEIGDRILLGNAVSPIEHEGKEYLIVKEKNILAKLG
jgi:chaperonin GroES